MYQIKIIVEEKILNTLDALNVVNKASDTMQNRCAQYAIEEIRGRKRSASRMEKFDC